MSDLPNNPNNDPWNPQVDPPANPYAQTPSNPYNAPQSQPAPADGAPQNPQYGGANPEAYGAPQNAPQYGNPPYGETPAYGAPQGTPQNESPQYGSPQYGETPAYGAPQQPTTDPYGQPATDPYGQSAMGYPNQMSNPYGQTNPYPGYSQMAVPAYTSWIKRVASHIIDWLPITVINRITDPMIGTYDFATKTDIPGSNPTMGYLIGLIGVAWFIWNMVMKDGKSGVSVGRQVMGIQLVDAQTGQAVGMGKAFFRQIAHVVDTIICMFGYLWPLWDSQRQTLADKICKTVVIDTK